MPLVDVVDDTFVRAEPLDVRAATRAHWEDWLAGPRDGLSLRLREDRGEEGVRWDARARTGRRRRPVAWTGTAEVWLERAWGGTVVHLYLRLEPGPAGDGRAPADPRRLARHARRLQDTLRRSWKRGLVHATGRVRATRTG